MVLVELIRTIGLNVGISDLSIAVVLVLSIIQIAPIEINPLSCIARMIGRELNKDVLDRVENIEIMEEESKREIDKLSYDVSKNRAIFSRSAILQFNDDLLHNIAKSKESFDHILIDITYYESFCRKYPEFKNNVAVLSISNIKKVYEQRLQTNDFLQ